MDYAYRDRRGLKRDVDELIKRKKYAIGSIILYRTEYEDEAIGKIIAIDEFHNYVVRNFNTNLDFVHKREVYGNVI